MIDIDNLDLLRLSEQVRKAYSDLALQPLKFIDFQRKIAAYHLKIHPFKPRTIKIAKEIPYLVKGDFEPQQVIQMDSPPMVDGIPYWFGDSSKELLLYGFGFINGDSRYPSDVGLSNSDPHGYLAGVSGHGKSVVLNALLMMLMWMYGPWELVIYMSDAKVTEFLKYSGNYTPPHIKIVSATGDADFTISMLENIVKDMKKFNVANANYGGALQSFREQTGLTVPRVLFIGDEIQALLTEAEDRSSEITSKFSQVTKEGRSAGVHFYTASQEVAKELQSILGNVTIRGSLGAHAEVSTMVLGNDEAKINYKKIGRLIINQNSANKSAADNKHLRVPYISPEEFTRQKKILSELGDQFGFKYKHSCYNQDLRYEEPEFVGMIKKDDPSLDMFVLGEPAYIMNNTPSNYLRIQVYEKELSNTLLLGGSGAAVWRLATIFRNNLNYKEGKVLNVAFCATLTLKEKFDKIGVPIEHVSSITNHSIQGVLSEAVYRKLLIELDTLVFRATTAQAPLSEEMLRKMGLLEQYNKHTITLRLNGIVQLLNTSDYQSLLGLRVARNETLAADNPLIRSIIEDLLDRILMLSPSGEQITVKSFRPLFIWILEIESMLGLGIDEDSGQKEKLKKIMQTSNSTRTYFINSTRESKGMGQVLSSYRYLIFDAFPEDLASNLGVPKYPKKMTSPLSILYDRMADQKICRKFKTIEIEEEES
jgi:hypothetical protein